MHKHDHGNCKHESVRYCAHCGVVYCERCGQEWGQRYWIYPSYPYTIHPYPTYPVWCGDNTSVSVYGSKSWVDTGERYEYGGPPQACKHEA